MIDQALGRDCVLQKIGEGGMGVVYFAHDSELKLDVALKMLREESRAMPCAGSDSSARPRCWPR